MNKIGNYTFNSIYFTHIYNDDQYDVFLDEESLEPDVYGNDISAHDIKLLAVDNINKVITSVDVDVNDYNAAKNIKVVTFLENSTYLYFSDSDYKSLVQKLEKNEKLKDAICILLDGVN